MIPRNITFGVGNVQAFSIRGFHWRCIRSEMSSVSVTSGQRLALWHKNGRRNFLKRFSSFHGLVTRRKGCNEVPYQIGLKGRTEQSSLATFIPKWKLMSLLVFRSCTFHSSKKILVLELNSCYAKHAKYTSAKYVQDQVAIYILDVATDRKPNVFVEWIHMSNSPERPNMRAMSKLLREFPRKRNDKWADEKWFRSRGAISWDENSDDAGATGLYRCEYRRVKWLRISWPLRSLFEIRGDAIKII